MTTANLDAGDLKAVELGGLINEDVMNQIWDISNIPLPMTDAIGSDTTGNDYTEWTTDRLRDPALGGWVVDGADSDQNDSNTGSRIGNHAGILTKEVRVSTRARESDTIGYSDALSYQVMMRQRELRRDVEANLLGIQGARASDPDAGVAGIPASIPVMMEKFDTGSGGTGGTFGGSGWVAWTPGTRVGLTETMVRDACQEAYLDNGDPSQLMSHPLVIRKLSEYMFTSSSRIATLTRETGGMNAQEAVGAVNMFLTDFDIVLKFVPNRIQQLYKDSGGTNDAAAVMLLDPAYARVTYLHGYRVEPLAKTGLSDKRLMAVDFTAKVLEPKAHRVLMDINPAAAVTQS